MFFQRGQSLPVGKVTNIGSAVLTALSDKDLSHSSIVVRVNHSDWYLGRVEQPLRGRVMLGSLTYASRSTNFLASRPTTAELVATNKFNFPLQFFSASVGAGDAAGAFSVAFDAASVGTVVLPGGAFPPVTVSFHGHPADAAAPKILSVPLGVQTDTALILVPLTVYHNRLLCAAEEGGKYTACGNLTEVFSFGLVAAGERRERHLYLLNPNPLPIEVARVSSTFDEVVSLSIRAHTPNKLPSNATAVAKSGQEISKFLVPSGFTATLTVTLAAARQPARRSGTLTVQLGAAGGEKGSADASQKLSFPVSYRSVAGAARLQPARLLFAPAFPGKQPLPEVELSLTHNFTTAVRVSGITSADGRFLVLPSVAGPTAVPLPGGSPHRVATVRFDPSRLFDSRHNYMSSQLLSKGAGADDFWLDDDLLLLRQREAAWKLLSPDASGTAVVSSQIHVQTDVAQRTSAEVRGQLVWPQVVQPIQYFGAAELGATLSIPLVVINPSHEPLNVAILPHLAPTPPGRSFDPEAKAHPPDFSVSSLVRFENDRTLRLLVVVPAACIALRPRPCVRLSAHPRR